MVALVKYMAVSTLAASIVVYHAFATRQHFFPATLYLSSSKVAAATIGNLAFASALLVHKLVIKVFLGALRDSEREMIQERLSSAVMESLLALTIFREEFSAFFVVMFASLVFIKVLHWLVQDRVDYAEVTPSISLLQHLRIISFLAFLLLLDSTLLQYTVLASISSNGQSVMLLFAFEYVIQASNVVRYGLKYALSMIDLAWEGRWEHKGTAVFYLELVTDLLHLSVYVVFFVIVFMHYGLPLHLMRDLYSTFNNFRNRIQQFLRFRQVTARLDRFPDATPEDLERCAGVCIICREDMGPGGSNKRLSCGHVFHLHCLRSWLGQQQICPTCRASVFRPPAPASVAAPVAAAAAAVLPAGVPEGDAAAVPLEVPGGAAAAAPDVMPARGGWPAQPVPVAAAAAPVPLRRLEEESDDEFLADEEVQAELAMLRAERVERETHPHSYRAAILDAANRMHRASGGGGASGSGSYAGAGRPRPRPVRDAAGGAMTELQTLMDMLGRAPNPAARPPQGTSMVWVLQPTHTGAAHPPSSATPEQQAAAAASAAVAAAFCIPVTSVTSTVISQSAASFPFTPSLSPSTTTTPLVSPQPAVASAASTTNPTSPMANLVASLVATQGIMALQLQQLAALVAAAEAHTASMAVAANVAAVAAAAAAAAAATATAAAEAASKATAAAEAAAMATAAADAAAMATAAAEAAAAAAVAPPPPSAAQSGPVSSPLVPAAANLPPLIPAEQATAPAAPPSLASILEAARARAALRLAEFAALTANPGYTFNPAPIDQEASMRALLNHIQSGTPASIQEAIDALTTLPPPVSPAAQIPSTQAPSQSVVGVPQRPSSSAATPLAARQQPVPDESAGPAPVDDADETQRDLRRRRLQKFDVDNPRF